MNRVLGFLFAALCLATFIAACERDTQPRAGSAQRGGAAAVADVALPSRNSGESTSPCPRTGRWAICTVEKRLEQSGFVLRKSDGENPRRLGFTVRPLVYALGRARLEIFLYPDEAAVARDLATMDTALVAPRGQNNDWEIPPRLVRSGNLVAVFLTRNEQQAERLTLAITAGPPQP